MKITAIQIGVLKIPLQRPFITAVRRTDFVEDVVVMIKTDQGRVGYGSAAATPAITGESQASIIEAIRNFIAPKLLGQSINQFNQLLYSVQNSLINNTSAKAAIDIALHDLFAQHCNLPLYRFLGGNDNRLKTSVTISVKQSSEMAEDAKRLVAQGFKTLKIKVGLDPIEDFNRIKLISETVGNEIKLVIDVNQGWNSKQAIQVINKIKENHINLEMIEQPVKAGDFSQLKFIHDRVENLIIADESCFSPQDAFVLARLNACDGFNIKLMKSAGIYNANAIYQIAQGAYMKCMVGCMLESPIGVAAMASFAVSKPNILLADLDPIGLIKTNPVINGAQIKGNEIVLSEKIGLGIDGFSEGFNLITEVTHAL